MKINTFLVIAILSTCLICLLTHSPSAGTLNFKWTKYDNSLNDVENQATGLRIYSQAGDAVEILIGQIPLNVTKASIGFNETVATKFWAVAYNAEMESDPSNIVSWAPPGIITAPDGLEVEYVESTSEEVVLTPTSLWEDATGLGRGWTKIDSNNFTNSGGYLFSNLDHAGICKAGKTYDLTWRLYDAERGAVQAYVISGENQSPEHSEPGEYVDRLTATVDGTLRIQTRGGGYQGGIEIISLTEVTE